ncbi:MAG: PilW family protein [Burkholderiales bacterium]
MSASFLPATRIRQAGISLIELMVGVVIGMLAVLVIYQTFAVAEGVKRQTISAGDAQQTGMLATYLLGVEFANAGNGISTNIGDLVSCPDTKDIKTTMRPVAVVITKGADDDTPDSFVVNYGTPKSLVTPALFVASAAAGDTEYKVQSPTGFQKGDMAIAVSGTGSCERVTIKDVTAPDGNGVITATLESASVNGYPPSARLINIGPATSAQRVQYDVVNGVLRSTDLVVDGATAAPIASSIVNLKLQYGVDADDNGTVDTWTAAEGDYAPDKVLAADAIAIRRIKAVRVGVVVRSDEYDRDAPTFDWTLFQCTDEEKKIYTCPDALKGTLPANYRYRVYETIVPLRNAMWNKS